MKNTNSNDYYERAIAQSPALQASIEDAQLSIDISMQISKIRAESGITQKQLAKLAGIQQSNISRLESPGYQGYTLKVLSKVVRALGAKLRIQIIKPPITATSRHDFLSEDRNMSSLKTLPSPTTLNSHAWTQEGQTLLREVARV